MNTQVFAHNGVVGIQAGDAFLNDPTAPGQLGCIVDLNTVDVSQEAFDLLLKVKKSHDAIGDVMCWKAGEKQCFGWLGGPLHMITNASEGDRDYDPELLRSRISKVEVPEDFKAAVERKE